MLFHSGVVTAIKDAPRFEHHSRASVCTVVGCLGMLLSTMFASSLGTYLLDAIDHYVCSPVFCFYPGSDLSLCLWQCNHWAQINSSLFMCSRQLKWRP